MNTLIVLMMLFLLTLLGFCVFYLANVLEKKGFLEKISFSFALGIGICTFQMYLYSRFGVMWSPTTIVFPWTAIYIAAILKFKPHTFKIQIQKPKSIMSLVLLVLIIILMAFTSIEATLRPLNAWDGYASWLFRSKMYFIEGSIDPSLVTYLPTEYPPLVSLLGTFLYVFLGQIDDRAILITYAVFYISLGSLFYYSVKEKTGGTMALFFTFLLLSTQNLVRHSGRFEAGQADVILGYFLFVSFLLFFEFVKKRSVKTLAFLHFFLLVTALTKNDGVPLVLLVEIVLVALTIRQFGYKKLILSIIFIVPFFDWQVFKYFEGVVKSPEYIGSSIYPQRLPIIIKEFFKELFNIQNWNLMWLAVIVSACTIRIKQINLDLATPFIVLAIDLVVLASVFFVTTPNPSEHIPNVLNRALLHIAPIGVYAVSMCSVLLKLKFKNEK